MLFWIQKECSRYTSRSSGSLLKRSASSGTRCVSLLSRHVIGQNSQSRSSFLCCVIGPSFSHLWLMLEVSVWSWKKLRWFELWLLAWQRAPIWRWPFGTGFSCLFVLLSSIVFSLRCIFLRKISCIATLSHSARVAKRNTKPTHNVVKEDCTILFWRQSSPEEISASTWIFEERSGI